ncbi:MAG: NAD(P)-dependent oxidoreductase [Acidimicrobiia bacterium]|nr:MAG: NAD(P)-dependent oxidoreductase [Acidimicrobiia bacterium]GIU90924.1 MAG: NAD(P)-dependent oxidoreductase [Acidimicrobiia bacterium]
MKVLVTGAAGQVGREVVEAAAAGAHEVVGLDHAALDVTDAAAVREAVRAVAPGAIVNCAAFAAVDRCETEPDVAFAVNADAVRHLARAADEVGAYLVHISTDYVFDGRKPDPYVETDTPNPLSVYGRSKLAGEQALDPERAAIVRASWICGRYGANMVKTILRLAGEHEKLSFVSDQRGHPTIAADLARMLWWFVEERPAGVWHVTNQGAVSWYEFAQEVLRANGDDPARVLPITTEELQPPRPAPRPANSVLRNQRLIEAGVELLPDFRESLAILVRSL